MRRNQKRTMSAFAVGMIALVGAIVITYLGFTKSIPFRSHYEVKAEFRTSNNLRPNSPVRIAGVNVGKVTNVDVKKVAGEPQPISVVTMRVEKNGVPLHTDARAMIRPRIFLEGNFFVDLQPGTSARRKLDDGGTIPFSQTATPVQLDQILTTLQADTRRNLQKLLLEYGKAISGAGSLGFNRSIQYWQPAYKNSAIVNQATLGLRDHDLSGYIRDSGIVAGALDRSPAALKSLITDFNTTAAAFAVEQDSLRAAVAELPRTLSAAQPALLELNRSFPPLRRLIVDLRPATRSTGPAIDASLPFVTQARALITEAELRGLTRDLRPLVPSLARLNSASIPLLQQVRKASSCQNNVILPWSEGTVPDPDFAPPKYPKLPIFQEAVKFLPGIAGESRSGDANGQWFKVLAANGSNIYQLGNGRVASSELPILGTNPPKSAQPPIRYDVPCETQQPPDLRTKTGPPPTKVNAGPPNPAALAKLRLGAVNWLRESLIREGYASKLVQQGFQPLTDAEKQQILKSGNKVAAAGAGLKLPGRALAAAAKGGSG